MFGTAAILAGGKSSRMGFDKQMLMEDGKRLLEKVIENGNVLIERRDLEEIRSYCAEQLETLWDEVKRFENPHKYYVDLSPQMYEMKVGLLEKLNF